MLQVLPDLKDDCGAFSLEFALRPGHSVKFAPLVQFGLMHLDTEKLVFRMCEERENQGFPVPFPTHWIESLGN